MRSTSAAGHEFLVLDALANAVAAQLHDFADCQNVAGFDVSVRHAVRVQRMQGFRKANRDFARLGDGERTLFENLGKRSVGWLHQREGERDAFKAGLAEAANGDQVLLLEFNDALPAREDLVFVVHGLGQPDDGRRSGAVRGVEEGAASLGPDEPFKRVGSRDCLAFVVAPKFHACVLSRSKPSVSRSSGCEGRKLQRAIVQAARLPFFAQGRAYPHPSSRSL